MPYLSTFDSGSCGFTLNSLSTLLELVEFSTDSLHPLFALDHGLEPLEVSGLGGLAGGLDTLGPVGSGPLVLDISSLPLLVQLLDAGIAGNVHNEVSEGDAAKVDHLAADTGEVLRAIDEHLEKAKNEFHDQVVPRL